MMVLFDGSAFAQATARQARASRSSYGEAGSPAEATGEAGEPKEDQMMVARVNVTLWAALPLTILSDASRPG
jgi:hypothetical protein